MPILDLFKIKDPEGSEAKRSAKEQYAEQSGTNAFDRLFNSGTKGEYLAYKVLTKFSDKNYCIANCYVPKGDGTTSEIDLVLVHETGIYVFESKNYIGYIFGDDAHKNWTVTLNAGKGRVEKHQFYNPIMQNKTHIKYLQKCIGKDVPFYSYIVFGEHCELKSVSYSDSVRVVYRRELKHTLRKDIKSRDDVLTQDEMDAIFVKLDALSHAGKEEKTAHVEEIKEKKAMVDNNICPLCGGKLVERTAKTGAYAGRKFYGCSNYPKCRFTKN